MGEPRSAKFLTDLERSSVEVECQLRTSLGSVTIVQSADIIEINRQPHMRWLVLISQRKHGS
jgi:hypothetical protein